MGRIDWAHLFFSSHGRLARGPFLLAGGGVLGVALLFRLATGDWVEQAAGWVVYGVALFSAACLLSRRLHDRGRRGWWSLLILWAIVVVWPEPDGVIDILWCLPLLWAGVELGGFPGEGGPNRFGPPPSPRRDRNVGVRS